MKRRLCTHAWILCGAVWAGAVLGAAPAAAGDYDPWEPGRRGFYLGGGGAWAHAFFEEEAEDFASDQLGVPVQLDIEDTWTATGVAGYRVFSWLAVEAQYEYVHKFHVEAEALGLADSVDVNGHVATGNLRFLVPSWPVQPFLLVGGGAVLYEANGGIGPTTLDSDTAPAGRLGLGADIYLTKHLLLNLSAQLVVSAQTLSSDTTGEDLEGLHYLSGTGMLQWRF